MKVFLSFLILLSSACATERKVSSIIPTETVKRLKKLYPAQTEAFILERLHNATSAFAKWRSFPPYYYELITRLKKSRASKMISRPGLCAGDPHLENFGFIYSDQPLFTLNDLDDVSLCSLDADIIRLLI